MSPRLSASCRPGSLVDFTSEDLIIPELRGCDSATVIQELTRALHRSGRIHDLLAFYHAAVNMEFLQTSATDYGIAFPHARVNEVSDVCVAVGRKTDPITWAHAGGARSVHLVFLIVLPAIDSDYISVVLSLAHLHAEPRVVSRLMSAPNTPAIMEALRGISFAPVETGER